MKFRKYHVSPNLANLYGVDKTALNLEFKTGENMTISMNGTKGSGVNVIPLVSPGITLPPGNYCLKIKMISGSIANLSDGVFFGINGNTFSMRTSPGVLQIGDIGVRNISLSEATLITSFDLTPGYGSVGSEFNNATFECMMYKGSSADNVPYEPYSSEVWHDLTSHIMSTTWQDGSTYSRSGGSWSSSLTKKRSRKKK